MQQLQSLLHKLDVIRIRQELIRPKDGFNVFRILRQESDEVNLHSRFIYELLNPAGKHEMGSIFLQAFVEICKLPALSYDTVQVFRERANIDILITDNQQAIVIENKIYAIDQYEQLKRYYEYTNSLSLKPTLLYLTLDGREPKNWSLRNLKTELISYNLEIDQWITICIKESATKSGLREVLVQYRTLIRSLTGNNMDETEKEEVIRLISQDNNAERGAILARNWNHVRWHTEQKFWNELLTVTEPNYNVLSKSKFTNAAIDVVVHGSRNKNYHYGIAFNIGRVYDNDIEFKIERGKEPLYYGFPHFSTDTALRSRMVSGVVQ